MDGFRQTKEPSLKSKVKELEAALENSSMAVRILQMSVQQMMQSFQGMDRDVGNTMGIANDLQYKTQAMIKMSEFDLEKLETIADELKLVDYTKASDSEDETKGYLVITDRVVADEDIVIITSTTADDDAQGIFRSKFKLSTCGSPELIESLGGATIGTKTDIEINGATHSVELLGIREETLQPEATELEKVLEEVEAQA